MLAGGLQILGLIALMAGACELLLRAFRGGPILPTTGRRGAIDPLAGYPPPGDAPCAWPRLELEVEDLRRKGAL